MPFMQRITWSGVAMHEGGNIGHPASHGCIRMPHEFATRLFGLTKLGARVIIARNELRPTEFADPHLFVHKEMPAPAPAAAAATAPESTRTAQAGDDNKKTDAVARPKSKCRTLPLRRRRSQTRPCGDRDTKPTDARPSRPSPKLRRHADVPQPAPPRTAGDEQPRTAT